MCRGAAQLSNSAEHLEYLESRILRIRHPHAIGQGEAMKGVTQTKSSGPDQSLFARRGPTQDSVKLYSK